VSNTWTRQVVLSLIDQELHHKGDWTVEEMTKMYCDISSKYTGMCYQNGNSLASWGHLSGGYDSRYYSYVWSRVISSDLYSVFSNAGALNPDIGLKYRKEILEPSSTIDSSEAVKNFLGRYYTIDAFLSEIVGNN
jgi:Zn-dependent oligopeptidase